MSGASPNIAEQAQAVDDLHREVAKLPLASTSAQGARLSSIQDTYAPEQEGLSAATQQALTGFLQKLTDLNQRLVAMELKPEGKPELLRARFDNWAVAMQQWQQDFAALKLPEACAELNQDFIALQQSFNNLWQAKLQAAQTWKKLDDAQFNQMAFKTAAKVTSGASTTISLASLVALLPIPGLNLISIPFAGVLKVTGEILSAAFKGLAWLQPVDRFEVKSNQNTLEMDKIENQFIENLNGFHSKVQRMVHQLPQPDPLANDAPLATPQAEHLKQQSKPTPVSDAAPEPITNPSRHPPRPSPLDDPHPHK